MEQAQGYGAQLDAKRLVEMLDLLLQNNLRAQANEQRPTPVCIWGPHGIGKTMIVEAYAKEKGWGFAYCAPAQFEEMGDLHGLPVLTKKQRGKSDQRTVFAPPDWVPKEEGPGILLLDDLNRADDRILRGLMQLLQQFEMFSWRLPPKWQIVATANPEGADYSVTPMDDAMLNRMFHLSLRFDVQAWARWATGVRLDPRGISFVLSYPEAITGRRSTPRSMTQFLRSIETIGDLKAQASLVQTLALSTLDDTTVASFMSFVHDNLESLMEPEEVLDAEDFAPVATRIEELAQAEESDVKRLDRLATLCTRLCLTLTGPDAVLSPLRSANLIHFLLHKTLPNDLRVSLHRDLHQQGSPALREALRDPKLAAILLEQL